MADHGISLSEQALADCFNALNAQNGSGGNGTNQHQFEIPYVSTGQFLGCDFTELAKALGSDIEAMNQVGYVAIVIVLYALVIVPGALGNTLVVLTVIKAPQMRTATNIFIANLALADIFVCVFDLPLNAHYQITGSWAFGEALCHVIPAAFAVVVYASTLSLTMIAIDRYLLIVKPTMTRLSIQKAMLALLGIAIISVAVASPIAIYAKYTVHQYDDLNYHTTVCSEEWPSVLSRRLYTVLTLIFQFVLPLVLIAILYTLIFNRLRQRMVTASQRRTKTTKMLVAVVVVFTVTWIPFHLFSLLHEFHQDLIPGSFYRFTDSILRVVAMSSSCINPFLYGWLNDNYRTAFLNLVRRPTLKLNVGALEETMDARVYAKVNGGSNNGSPALAVRKGGGSPEQLTRSVQVTEIGPPVTVSTEKGSTAPVTML